MSFSNDELAKDQVAICPWEAAYKDRDDAVFQLLELCNEKSRDFDTEWMDRMKGDMDGLILFATLFSAIVTAFLIQLSQQFPVMDNAPDPNHTRSIFIVWYLSLLIALFCALLAIMVGQWLREYNRSIKKQWSRRKKMTFRLSIFVQLQKIEVPVVQSLSFLLHLSLALFAAGLGLYLAAIDHMLSVVVWTANCIFVAVYLALSIVPFLLPLTTIHTPISSILGLALGHSRKDDLDFQLGKHSNLRILTYAGEQLDLHSMDIKQKLLYCLPLILMAEGRDNATKTNRAALIEAIRPLTSDWLPPMMTELKFALSRSDFYNAPQNVSVINRLKLWWTIMVRDGGMKQATWKRWGIDNTDDHNDIYTALRDMAWYSEEPETAAYACIALLAGEIQWHSERCESDKICCDCKIPQLFGDDLPLIVMTLLAVKSEVSFNNLSDLIQDTFRHVKSTDILSHWLKPGERRQTTIVDTGATRLAIYCMYGDCPSRPECTISCFLQDWASLLDINDIQGFSRYLTKQDTKRASSLLTAISNQKKFGSSQFRRDACKEIVSYVRANPKKNYDTGRYSKQTVALGDSKESSAEPGYIV